MDPRYSMIGGNRYGKGVWAPSIRKHDGLYYVYFPTPSEGIFVSTAAKITGPWSAPAVVMAQAGLEDPCPFWDEDGKAYLIHSENWRGAAHSASHVSRMASMCSTKGQSLFRILSICRFLKGQSCISATDTTTSLRRSGVLARDRRRCCASRQIYGPYEHRVVLAQGSTNINGPHQGAYVETPDGEGWFVHFQSDGAHGRIVHLEPVRWEDDWPVIGADADGAPTGQPTPSGPIPGHPVVPSHQRPQTSDDFVGPKLGPQWEWNHNPDDSHWSLTAKPGYLHLIPMQADGLLAARNTLTQCMQDNSFEFTVRLDLSEMKAGVHTGLAMFEKSASGIEIVQSESERRLVFFHLQDRSAGPVVSQPIIQLRVSVDGDEARYFFSLDDGKAFQRIGTGTPIRFSWWKGSRPALFAYTTLAGDPGAVDFDWVHYQPRGPNPW